MAFSHTITGHLLLTLYESPLKQTSQLKYLNGQCSFTAQYNEVKYDGVAS